MRNRLIGGVILAALVIGFAVTGCTDTDMAQMGAYGESGHIVCYSGGVRIVDDWSTGKVGQADSGADGFKWKSQSDAKLHESNSNCVVIHGQKKENSG